MIVQVRLGGSSYDVVIEHGCLRRAGELLRLDRRAMIVTDSGVPREYAETVAAQCSAPEIFVVGQGEGSKSFPVLEKILSKMLASGFTRGDCVVAVGGGVVGDLAGFVSAVYMRGVDFYNIPTTVLSQVDSSVGGKTAINLDGMKNIVGAFRQPKKVLIDPDTLRTLPPRQVSNGLAEAVKMALTSDAELFRLFETQAVSDVLDTVIERSVRTKADVVAQDETEQGLRRVLNFGHTIGHAIESFEGLHGLYHGECVALGMLPMCSETVRARLVPVLEKLGLPTALTFDAQAVRDAMIHDKKMQKDGVVAVYVDSVGSFRLETTPVEMLTKALAVIPKGETTR